jgi:hypothetical protein
VWRRPCSSPSAGCDTRSHELSELHQGGRPWGRRCSFRSVSVDLSPAWCASLVTAGCEAQVIRPKGSRSIREPQAAGKAGRVNASEPLMMPRHRKPRGWDAAAGPRTRRWEAAGADRKTLSRSGGHRRPRGIGGTQPGRISLVRNMTTPLGSVRITARGKLTVRKARVRSGRGMTQEANAGSRKATGKRDVFGRLLRWSSSYNRPDTGVRPDPKGC